MNRGQVIIAGVIAFCVTAASPEAQSNTAAVETTKVVAQVLQKTLTIPGDLTPYQGVNLSARVSGFVESLTVDRGSWVKRGQRLATISAPELRAQRAEAEAKLQAVRAQEAEAQARMVSAQSTYERLKAASATPGVVAGNDLEIAERGLEAARAHVNALKGSGGAAEAAVKAVSEMEAYLQLTAPFDGVITERNVHPGSLVGPSTGALLRIEQVARLRLTVPVPEAYVGSITRGTTVEFRVSAFPDQAFQGVIARPAHSLDMKTRSMLVELDVNNPKQVLARDVRRSAVARLARAGELVRAEDRCRTHLGASVRRAGAEWRGGMGGRPAWGTERRRHRGLRRPS